MVFSESMASSASELLIASEPNLRRKLKVPWNPGVSHDTFLIQQGANKSGEETSSESFAPATDLREEESAQLTDGVCGSFSPSSPEQETSAIENSTDYASQSSEACLHDGDLEHYPTKPEDPEYFSKTPSRDSKISCCLESIQEQDSIVRPVMSSIYLIDDDDIETRRMWDKKEVTLPSIEEKPIKVHSSPKLPSTSGIIKRISMLPTSKFQFDKESSLISCIETTTTKASSCVAPKSSSYSYYESVFGTTADRMEFRPRMRDLSSESETNYVTFSPTDISDLWRQRPSERHIPTSLSENMERALLHNFYAVIRQDFSSMEEQRAFDDQWQSDSGDGTCFYMNTGRSSYEQFYQQTVHIEDLTDQYHGLEETSSALDALGGKDKTISCEESSAMYRYLIQPSDSKLPILESKTRSLKSSMSLKKGTRDSKEVSQYDYIKAKTRKGKMKIHPHFNRNIKYRNEDIEQTDRWRGYKLVENQATGIQMPCRKEKGHEISIQTIAAKKTLKQVQKKPNLAENPPISEGIQYDPKDFEKEKSDVYIKSMKKKSDDGDEEDGSSLFLESSCDSKRRKKECKKVRKNVDELNCLEKYAVKKRMRNMMDGFSDPSEYAHHRYYNATKNILLRLGEIDNSRWEKLKSKCLENEEEDSDEESSEEDSVQSEQVESSSKKPSAKKGKEKANKTDVEKLPDLEAGNKEQIEHLLKDDESWPCPLKPYDEDKNICVRIAPIYHLEDDCSY